MIDRFGLTAADLKDLNEFKLTRFESTGEVRISLYYDGPEAAQAFAERRGVPVEIDGAHVVEGIGVFYTATAEFELGAVSVLAIGTRALTKAERAELVSA